MKNFFTSDKNNILSLSIIWVIIIIIINPLGDFPLNDSWSYAKPVQSLLNGDGIQFTGWMSMTLFTQVLWGALWCEIFGFSFTVLRFSTLFLGFIGLIYSYKLIKKFIDSYTTSFLLTLIILFNPLYMNLSFTYMTDVPFYAFSVISIYYFTIYLGNDSKLSWFLGVLFSLIAMLTRQLALVIPLSVFFIGVIKLWRKKQLKTYYFLPFAICLLSFICYQYIAHQYFGAHGRYDEMNNKLLTQVLSNPFLWMKNVLSKSVIGGVYLSLLSSPFWLSMLIKKPYNLTRFRFLILIAVSAAGLTFLVDRDYVFPILDNVINEHGLGPTTLYYYWETSLQNIDSLRYFPRLMITFFAVFGFLYLILHFLKWKNLIAIVSVDKNKFLSLILITYVLVICSIYTTDRYYLFPLLIFILVLVVLTNAQFNKVLFSILMFACVWYSVLGTKDYLSWNRARWVTTNYLITQKNIQPDKVDGGFEYNGWYNYNDEDQPSGLKNLWVHDADYIIAFEQLEGTEVIYEESYFSWLWMKEKSIKALKKNAEFKGLEEPFY